MRCKGLFTRSRDLVVAFMDLFVSFRDSFINYRNLLRNLLVIFIRANGININKYLILPVLDLLILPVLDPEGDNFTHLLTCTYCTLFFSLYLI